MSYRRLAVALLCAALLVASPAAANAADAGGNGRRASELWRLFPLYPEGKANARTGGRAGGERRPRSERRQPAATTSQEGEATPPSPAPSPPSPGEPRAETRPQAARPGFLDRNAPLLGAAAGLLVLVGVGIAGRRLIPMPNGRRSGGESKAAVPGGHVLGRLRGQGERPARSGSRLPLALPRPARPREWSDRASIRARLRPRLGREYARWIGTYVVPLLGAAAVGVAAGIAVVFLLQ